MELKGKTVYVVRIEGAYAEDGVEFEVFADEADAQAYKTETEADWSTNPPRQQHWCTVEPTAIR